MTLHPLGELIASIEKANDWSDYDVSARARAQGHPLSKSTVARVRNEEMKAVRGSLLTALAAGLDIPVRQVVQAALQTMDLPGLRDFTSTSPEDAIRSDPTIAERDKSILLAQLHLMRSTSHATDSHALDSATPSAPTKRGV